MHPLRHMLIGSVGGVLTALGILSVFVTQARKLPMVPDTTTGAILLPIGICLMVFSMIKLRKVERELAPQLEARATAPLPNYLRPVEWFSLVMAVGLAAYGVAGLLPQTWNLNVRPKPWWMNILLVIAGLVGAWHSYKTLARRKP